MAEPGADAGMTDPTGRPDLAGVAETDALLTALGGSEPAARATADPAAGVLAGLRAGLDRDYLQVAAGGAFSTVGRVVPAGGRLVRGSLIAAVGVAVALSATGVAAAVSADHSDALFPLHKLLFGAGHEWAVDQAGHLLTAITADLAGAERSRGVTAAERANLTTRLNAVDALVAAGGSDDSWHAIAVQLRDLRRRLAELHTLSGPGDVSGPAGGPSLSPSPDDHRGGNPVPGSTSGGDDHGSPAPEVSSSPDDHGGGPSPQDGGGRGGHVATPSSSPTDGSGKGSGNVALLGGGGESPPAEPAPTQSPSS